MFYPWCLARATILHCTSLRFGHGLRLRRIGDLDDEIFCSLARAAVARDRMQRAGCFIERLTRSQPLQRTVVDLYLVGAFQDIAESMAARMAVRSAAAAGIALDSTDSHHAAEHIGHRRREKL